MTPTVLVVDDDSEMVMALAGHLRAEGWTVTAAAGGHEAVTAIRREPFDIVLTDLRMDGLDGLAVVREARRLRPGARVILMTAYASLESAVEAIRRGAFDYLIKPFRVAEMIAAVRRALADRESSQENLDGQTRAPRQDPRPEENRGDGLERLRGRSPAMLAVLDQIRALGTSEATVLLVGESGTGKELAARAIHSQSPRRERSFVAVNCAAIPAELLESELFGHEKGAFTGATARRPGLFAEANGGTLLLDEVGDLPASLQPKLLRALQEKVVRPVGGTHETRIDFRLIAATNRDLRRLVADRTFREDLYYRLAVIPIRLPSLRERPEDITLLAGDFLARAAAGLGKALRGFEQEALAWLAQHRWPGNVRELENVVERAATLARGPEVTLADLRIDLAWRETFDASVRPTLAELESDYVRRVLDETKGDKHAAARILGVSVRTLQRRFE